MYPKTSQIHLGKTFLCSKLFSLLNHKQNQSKHPDYAGFPLADLGIATKGNATAVEHVNAKFLHCTRVSKHGNTKKKSMPYVPPFSIPGSATDFMEFRGSSVCGVEYTVVYSTCTLIVMDGVICHDLLDRCQPI